MFVLTPEGLRGVIAPVVTAYGGGLSEELQWFDDQWEDVCGVYRTQSSVRSVVDFLGGHLSRIRLKVNGPDGWMADHDLQHLLDRPMADKPVGRIDFWLGMWNDMLIYD